MLGLGRRTVIHPPNKRIPTVLESMKNEVQSYRTQPSESFVWWVEGEAGGSQQAPVSKALRFIVPFRPKLTPCIFHKLSIRRKFFQVFNIFDQHFNEE